MSNRHMAFPFAVGGNGRTRDASNPEYLRQLVEQVLLTAPGERVNRPDFGSGLMQLVFAAGGPEVASSVEGLTRGALQRILGELIRVERLDVTSEDNILRITVVFTDLETQRRDVVRVSQGI